MNIFQVDILRFSVDIINSTLGKALGGASGGYTAGPKEIVDLLRQKARPYLFSNTLAPPVVGAALSAIDLLEIVRTNYFFGFVLCDYHCFSLCD